MIYKEVKGLNLPEIDREILAFWQENDIFKKSIENREGQESFVFYEGPPSANGKPGIHHVMSRAVKDLFCRYQTLKGKKVHRKGGWDTHGLPIELSVEKELGITKEDIGVKISIDDYNHKCRETVMRFKNEWDDVTRKMGYWVDLDHPYITFENEYIESVWYLLKEIYKKGFLYKGYTIQPFSPAAGTGLSSHELNQPGAYREVKDVSAVALFKLKPESYNAAQQAVLNVPGILVAAWTTTPWTLPSNTALAVGETITYTIVECHNPYTHELNRILLAKDLVYKWFKPEHEVFDQLLPANEDKKIHFKILISEIKGKQLEGIRYEALFDYAVPDEGDAHKILIGDFVSTADGTGIVHIAPSFGADDMRVAKKYGIGTLTLVDKQGRFTNEVYDFAGEYVKEDYLSPEEKAKEKIRLGLEKYLSVDERLVIKLKKEGKLFNSQKYLHNYPHCWRTDKPILYYPLDSWFIRVTAVKDRLIALNNTIQWKPAATGTGRFGNWLENLQDWNLSRSRYWGIPLPIWRNADNTIEKCIGSLQELQAEIELANKAFGLNQMLPKDIHRPYIDEIILSSPDGKEKLTRELDLIDVWFDSGSMPYAQIHYPFSNKSLDGLFPADFIAEGVDQTRGWFYTLHAISTMVFDSVAYKAVVSNGLVLDKNGEKMSKRKGNVVDPFLTLNQYGADATRWYLISNADPWENLKFDLDGITEVRNKFFGTLYNTYSFFAIYANIDQFQYDASKALPLSLRSELDQWIVSRLQSVISQYRMYMDDFEPTQAARVIESFVSDDLSNWFVRLSRRRYWKSESSSDKQAAFETLYECLYNSSILIASLAPFFSDWLYKNLIAGLSASDKAKESVHLTDLPDADPALKDMDLERRMDLAQRICSQVLSLRKAQKIRVRQPLKQILIPILQESIQSDVQLVEDIIKSEVNVKEINYISGDAGLVKKKTKPNFRTLGKKLGKHMKEAAELIQNFNEDQISLLEKDLSVSLEIDTQNYSIIKEDVEILSEDIPGWLVSHDGELTVALDISISEELLTEGHARELINRIQNIRKDKDFNVTDKIVIKLQDHKDILKSLQLFKELISMEVLASSIEISNEQFDEQFEWLEEEKIGYRIQIA
ncbi:MAG: isoleucine--tRNA ligase [Saprospiraceae bacterium]|nr:isoleucine--tRNA ligase [Saprospiraceae bacterium]MBK7738392.1 isoleucine--tRNA ligase [Saprospiraceae bacterium]MBK7913035.1 isoleucine--tRNA ligase [Saprospiraceae bacterium]